jgi:hypothetical protein
MEPLHHSKAFPALGRTVLDHAHASYCVVLLLQPLGLSSWSERLLTWLGSYDGLEEHLDCDPACSTRDVLFQHAVACPPVRGIHLRPAAVARRKAAIVDDLLALDFLRCRAYWGPFLDQRRAWNPLEQTWLSFLETGPEWHDGETGLHIWTQLNGVPEHVPAIRRFLLGADAPHRGCSHAPR